MSPRRVQRRLGRVGVGVAKARQGRCQRGKGEARKGREGGREGGGREGGRHPFPCRSLLADGGPPQSLQSALRLLPPAVHALTISKIVTCLHDLY